jgi:hypothetical protein
MIVAKFSSVLSDKKIFQQVYRRMTTHANFMYLFLSDNDYVCSSTEKL